MTLMPKAGWTPGNAQVGHGAPPVTCAGPPIPEFPYAAKAPAGLSFATIQLTWPGPVRHPFADCATSRSFIAFATLNVFAEPPWLTSTPSNVLVRSEEHTS